MTVERGKVVPLKPRKGGLLCTPKRPPGRPRSTWRQALVAVRPWLLLIGVAVAWYLVDRSAEGEPPPLLATGAQVIDGSFTRCGPGRGAYCVVDGDTFRVGEASVRVHGIDTAEVEARCQQEAEQAEASTRALQDWLNRGTFTMTALNGQPTDRYGRALRVLTRITPDGRADRADRWMIAEGGARPYAGDARQGWC